jgi:hypothetical protein
MHLCAGDKTAADALRVFVEKHGVKVLNVAGRGRATRLGWGVSDEDASGEFWPD